MSSPIPREYIEASRAQLACAASGTAGAACGTACAACPARAWNRVAGCALHCRGTLVYAIPGAPNIHSGPPRCSCHDTDGALLGGDGVPIASKWASRPGLAMGVVARIGTSPLNGMPKTSQHAREVGRHFPNKMDSNAVQDAAGGVMGRSCVCPAALQPGISHGESLAIPGEDMPNTCRMSSCKATNPLLFCQSFPGLIGTKAMRPCPSKRWTTR